MPLAFLLHDVEGGDRMWLVVWFISMGFTGFFGYLSYEKTRKAPFIFLAISILSGWFLHTSGISIGNPAGFFIFLLFINCGLEGVVLFWELLNDERSVFSWLLHATEYSKKSRRYGNVVGVDDDPIDDYAHESGAAYIEDLPTYDYHQEFRQLYLKLIKLAHPDLATNPDEIERRTRLIQQVNALRDAGDLGGLQELYRQL